MYSGPMVPALKAICHRDSFLPNLFLGRLENLLDATRKPAVPGMSLEIQNVLQVLPASGANGRSCGNVWTGPSAPGLKVTFRRHCFPELWAKEI